MDDLSEGDVWVNARIRLSVYTVDTDDNWRASPSDFIFGSGIDTKSAIDDFFNDSNNADFIERI